MTIEIMTGTTGRARIAPPVAIAADTPQMEIPEARHAAHSRGIRNRRRAAAYMIGQNSR